MQSLLKMIRKDMVSTVLVFVLSVFIIFDIAPPPFSDTLLGRLLIAGGVIFLLFVNPVVGALGVVAAYLLFRRVDSVDQIKYIPSERKRMRHLRSMNTFPKTLEEEIVQKMLPSANPGSFPPAMFEPYPNKLHNASGV